MDLLRKSKNQKTSNRWEEVGLVLRIKAKEEAKGIR